MTFQHIAAISIILSLLTFVPVSLAAGEIMITDTLESAEWFTNSGTPAPSSASLQELQDSIIFSFIDPSLLHRFEEKERPEWSIDTVGHLGSLLIVDLVLSGEFSFGDDSTRRQRVPILKAIAGETGPAKYRLLYVLGGDLGQYAIESSFFVQTDGHRILCTDCQMFGTGAFHAQQYWVWDSIKCIPIELKIDRPLRKALDTLLPEGHGIWKGGGSDVHTLYYEKWTWRDGDGNCCPSGGKVRVQLGLRDGGPYVKWGRFDFSDLEERVAWDVLERGDSSYVKRPPILVDSIDFGEESSESWKYFDHHQRMYLPCGDPRSIRDILERTVRSSIQGIIYDNPETTEFNWDVDTIGPIDDLMLVKANYAFACKRCRDTTGKAVLVGDSRDMYRLLYMECTIKDRGPSERDTILELSGESVVAIKGCLNFVSDYTDHYWLYDHKERTFVSLYQEWTLCETLGRVLPHHIPSGSYALLHKGEWGFTKLDYNTPIWRKGDLKNQPTGGTARIQFGLKNRRFQPISISYTPPDSLLNKE